MKKLMFVILGVVLLLMPLPAQAGRLEDLNEQYDKLLAQKIEIEKQLLRIEGMFAERRMIIAEQEVVIEAAEEVEKEGEE